MHRLLLSLAALPLVGCANLSIPSTGFLAHREQLETSPEHHVRFIPDGIELYLAAGLDADAYDSILVEPVVYRAAAEPGHRPSEKAVKNLEARFTKYLRNTLGRDFDVVEQAGPRTMRVRAAIAEVNPSNVLLNILTVILVVPVDMGGISGQIELLDSQSGERLLALAAYREGTPFLLYECFFKYGHARHGMKKWSRKLRSILKETRGSSGSPRT